LRQRNTDQNAKLHATIHELASKKQWAGQWLEDEDWKRLLIAAWERTHGRGMKILPALDGSGFDVVYRRSSRLTKEEMADLIEFVESWVATNT
jgi:hypothetical protein